MTAPIRGQAQDVEYGSSASRLYAWVVDDFGYDAKPDAAPQITVYSPGGATLVSATAMTVYAGTDTGFLNYDAQTAEFQVGATLTGGTSTATALIVGQQKVGTTGTLQLVDIAGTFQNNETITDSESGSATANLTLWQNMYYYDLDASSTTNYPLGKNYSFKATYAISSRTMVPIRTYFDVTFFPANRPLITSSRIEEEFPELIGKCPDEWVDWGFACRAAHRKLVAQMAKLGDKLSYYAKRKEELGDLELVYARLKIAESLGESEEKLDYWRREASETWASRGEFAYDSNQDDSEIDEGPKVVSSGFTR